MSIISADGFWEFHKKTSAENTLLQEFPGTIINIEINLKDNKKYFSNFINLKESFKW